MSAVSESPHSVSTLQFPEGEFKLGAGGRVYLTEAQSTRQYTAIFTNIAETVEHKRVSILLDNGHITPEVWILNEEENVADRLRMTPNADMVEILHCNGTEEPLRALYRKADSETFQLPLGFEVSIPSVPVDKNTTTFIKETFSGLQSGLDHSAIGTGLLHKFATIPESLPLPPSDHS